MQDPEVIRQVLHDQVDEAVNEMKEADQQLDKANKMGDEKTKKEAIARYNKALSSISRLMSAGLDN